MRKSLWVVSVILILAGNAWGQSSPMVRTDAGVLAGSTDSTGHVSIFKGVPFAAPPVGDLRWREPQPVRPWNGTREALVFGPSAMQQVHGDSLPWTREFLVQNEVGEDCLYLNIWTPRLESKAKLPVLVYIHGGAFMEGSGAVPIYDGTMLARKGLVVVTLNYRLGVFGFLAHPELSAESPHRVSGNYGLMDQIAALKWVQKNIVSFGGDPSCVTIWGQSAGAASVGDLLASPQAKGLFHRAIADSGLSVAAFPMRNLRAAEQDGIAFATNHHALTLKELRTLPADQLLSWRQYAPIVDGWLLPETPNAINERGGGSDVPIVTGYQANDCLLILPPVNSPDDYARHLKSQFGEMADEFKQLYPCTPPATMRSVLVAGARDRERVSMFLWAQQRLKTHKAPVYTYFFVRGIPWPQHPEFGAFHTAELPYFFENLHLLDRPWEPVDRQLAKTVSERLKAFAVSGNPNLKGLPEWTAVKPNSPTTFEIGEKMKQLPIAEKTKFDFWLRYFRSPNAANAPFL